MSHPRENKSYGWLARNKKIIFFFVLIGILLGACMFYSHDKEPKQKTTEKLIGTPKGDGRFIE